MKNVVVAMSGGIDSSVAAYLLKQQGYKVSGLFMSLGQCLNKLAPKRKACCSVFDAADARSVAEQIGIEFSILDFKSEFERLIEYFCSEYEAGRTPNPCIRCNQYLKFGRLLEVAEKQGADFIATGHYAQIEPRKHSGCYLLKKGVDKTKDQSYVLFSLTQQQLGKIIFPLGTYTKKQVRKIAAEIDLPVKDKAESQEICFVPDNDCPGFLRQQLGKRIEPGPIRNLEGKIIGRHPGYQLFTIGQRHGLQIALGKPAYVVEIIPQSNTIVVGTKQDVYSKSLIADEVNWVSMKGLKAGEALEVEAKIRYLHPVATARIINEGTNIRVDFAEPQPAITPGQAVVFYQEDLVIGGGWIKQTCLPQVGG